MVDAALIEYFTWPGGVVAFVVKSGTEQPLLFHCDVGEAELHRCATRLIVDFHGLPPYWDAEPHTATFFRDVLALPPAVHPLKRNQPLLQRRLANRAFCYGMEYWERCAEALFPSSLREAIDDCDLLYVVPHGPLHALPFATLPWDGERALIDRFGLCQLPSATVLGHCQARNRVRRQPTHRPSSCLVVAVAAADDVDRQDFEADAGTLAALFDAPERRITSLVGETGPAAASKASVAAAAGDHDVIHLACHGVFSGDDPMDGSGLLLSDGTRAPALADVEGGGPLAAGPHLMSAREVLDLRLQADAVTLRACSSGRVDVASGDELLGLVRAFLYAGTPSLIVSLWNVHKLSSRALLEGFYRRWLGERLPKWRALQLAQLELRADPTFDHPYHWAAFVLMGDGL